MPPARILGASSDPKTEGKTLKIGAFAHTLLVVPAPGRAVRKLADPSQRR
jgi:hypothetical protein